MTTGKPNTPGSAPDESAGMDMPDFLLVLRLLKLGWRYRLKCLKVLLLQTILMAVGLSGLSLTGLGIDCIRSFARPGSGTPRWPFGISPPADWHPIVVIGIVAALILLFALARACVNYLYAMTLGTLVQKNIVVDLRVQVYEKLQRLSFRFFDSNASGTIINRVTRDVQATRMFIDGVIIQSIMMALSLAVFVTYMFNIHFKLTLACLATTPLLWITTSIFSRIVRPAYKKTRELFDEMITALAESANGIHVIKGFAREKERIKLFNAANDAVTGQNYMIFRKTSTFTPAVHMLSEFNVIILLAYGGYLAVKGDIQIGTGLVVFAGLLGHFSTQISNIANLANTLQESLSAARRVFEILDTTVEIRNPPHPVRLRPEKSGDVCFDHVFFKYRDDTRNVLKNINFEVRHGQRIAILGHTGAGKSTLMSLIPRFYDPSDGWVLIGGHDAKSLNLDDLRRNVGIVFQENFLFSNSVKANIAFGTPGASMEKIEKAARTARAHDFISAMPKGYDTILAEGGKDLSGGQRQRIAIARAIIQDPSILLLDDPTAAIDPETEREIMDSMENAMAGRTSFIVAHRLSTLRRADMIIVMQNGSIVQTGTHETLVNRPGVYRQIAALQLAEEGNKPPQS